MSELIGALLTFTISVHCQQASGTPVPKALVNITATSNILGLPAGGLSGYTDSSGDISFPVPFNLTTTVGDQLAITAETDTYYGTATSSINLLSGYSAHVTVTMAFNPVEAVTAQAASFIGQYAWWIIAAIVGGIIIIVLLTTTLGKDAYAVGKKVAKSVSDRVAQKSAPAKPGG